MVSLPLSSLTSDLELSAIGESDLKLIHLAGTNKYKLNNSERQAISDYVTKQNGTLFIETVGGQGEFAKDIEKQLAGVFQNPAVPLTTGDKIISGQGLSGKNRAFTHPEILLHPIANHLGDEPAAEPCQGRMLDERISDETGPEALARNVLGPHIVVPAHARRKGFCDGNRVGERPFDLQGVSVHAPEALHNVQLLAMLMASVIEPAFVAQPDRIHDQGVSVPLAN